MTNLTFDSIHSDDLITIDQRDSVRIARIDYAGVAAREQADLLSRITSTRKAAADEDKRT